jgi:hypothetical protein
MLLRLFLNDATSCASYLFGCGAHAKLAVVDPHAELVDDYLATASPDYRRSSRERAQPLTCQPTPVSSSSTSHWPTAMWSSSGTRS